MVYVSDESAAAGACRQAVVAAAGAEAAWRLTPDLVMVQELALTVVLTAICLTAPVGDYPSRVDSKPAPLARAVRCVRGG